MADKPVKLPAWLIRPGMQIQDPRPASRRIGPKRSEVIDVTGKDDRGASIDLTGLDADRDYYNQTLLPDDLVEVLEGRQLARYDGPEED